MGTNYYTPSGNVCEHCGRGDEELHIGKSSFGWQFLFASYQEHGLTSAAEWFEFLEGRPIKNEYGDSVTLDDLKEMVEFKQNGWNSQTAPSSAWGPSSRSGEYTDREGYRISEHAEFR